MYDMFFLKSCVEYIDIDYYRWLTWLLAPLILTFLLPGIIIILLYMTAIILYIYKWHRVRLKTAYEEQDLWQTARNIVAILWDAHGFLWHGFEITGLEYIPKDSAALIIYYHGAIPVDLYYFIAKVFLFRNRLIHTVADRFLFNIPGWKIISEVLKVIPGTVQTCSTILKEGNLLAISPGGVYEAQFSTSYELMWKKRLGFAKVAIDAKVPIIPMFTENVREAFRAVSLGRRIWLKLYAWTKFPFAPIYGGFPVKMRTHLGAPIPYDENLTPEELQTKVHQALSELIAKHQRIPGSITQSLIERVYVSPNKNLKLINSDDNEFHIA
ncbi:transmembrane protein 68 isoform X2 [Chrysoperla carnea]|uniref:transmembrane protein 68 isoform X2 n=1 Tax=Chrysoperla carnea TaxID=189513 RepID=UPI001D0604FB|nr:transmembrane protein 68 isoform X2 [Chrysoperla carnea]